ncbi:COMM domain-containing protein 6 [Anguilla anguilla]|uniref:COMM domain-containing protein 6 n=2 Tax=Anguilla anguilla TaxID=7936 RepID=A0A9D3RJZ3_ANGAN|nr:COMM domain-containing protein 6 [Anguilla anguilla]KAG5833113.1 hypothetical protein ANANG_G00272420 [Anguilla anguilla]
MLGVESAGGVDKIVENIGSLPTDLFAETCQQILSQLQGQSQAIDVAEICERFQKAGVRLDLGAAQEITKLLSFSFRSAAKSSLSAEQLISRLCESSSRWGKPALQVLHKLWSEQGSLVCSHQEVQSMITVGQLVDLQWKLGISISSDSCRSLNSPYVTLLLKTADTSGQVSCKSFEMTISQFQNFFKQFKEMAAVLETI